MKQGSPKILCIAFLLLIGILSPTDNVMSVYLTFDYQPLNS
jgi:hypothetical protein